MAGPRFRPPGDEEFARRLRALMKATGRGCHAANWLARRSGISYEHILKLAHEWYSPSLCTLRRLKEALECTWYDLLGP